MANKHDQQIAEERAIEQYIADEWAKLNQQATILFNMEASLKNRRLNRWRAMRGEGITREAGDGPQTLGAALSFRDERSTSAR